MPPEFETIEDAKAALRRAETALQQTLDREREIRQSERQRLAELAHEIKTPLNAMLGYTHMMSDQMLGDIGDPRYVEFARTVHDATKHLQEICDRILDHGSENADGPIDIAEVDVGEVAARVVRLFSRMATERGVNLAADVPTDFPNLRTDPKRLNQILMNLVSNAIKFTPSGGSVRIEAEYDEHSGAMIFVVADTGQVMCGPRLKDAVEPYKKGGRASPHGDDGIGLGLSIVDQLATQLRGELRLVSERDLGTVASICLPLSYDQDRVPARHDDLPADVIEAKSVPSIFSLHQSSAD